MNFSAENLKNSWFCTTTYTCRNISFPQCWYFLNALLFIYLFVYLFINVLLFCEKLAKFATNCWNMNFFLWLILFKSMIWFCISMLLFLRKYVINWWNLNFFCSWYLLNAWCFAQICQLIEHCEILLLFLKIWI